jgi:hypothetical protein
VTWVAVVLAVGAMLWLLLSNIRKLRRPGSSGSP